MGPMLSYLPSDPEPPSKPTIIEMGGMCRLILPPASRWVYRLNIGYSLLMGVLPIGVLGMLNYFILSIGGGGWVVIRGLWLMEVIFFLEGGVCLISAVIQLVHYYRYGRVPRMLEADEATIGYQRQKLLGIRFRRWDWNQVRGIEVRELKSLTKKPVAVLTVKVPGWWKVRLHLRGAEAVAKGKQFVARAEELRESGRLGKGSSATIVGI
jgi:hypothetical protein